MRDSLTLVRPFGRPRGERGHGRGEVGSVRDWVWVVVLGLAVIFVWLVAYVSFGGEFP